MMPIKILGFPRSGTSLLQRLLSSHPHVHCPPETYVFAGCARMIRETSGEGPNLGMLTGLAFSGFDEAEVLARVRGLAFGFMDDAACAAGKVTWAEKSAFDIFELDGIETLLTGHCRFISVVRNPMDVIASMKELTDQMGQNVPELLPWMAREPNYYLAWAMAWRDLTEALLALHERLGNQSLLYRYEDLVSDPDTQLARITDFAELPRFEGQPKPDTAQIGLGDWKVFTTSSVSQSSVARWRKSLPRSSARAALDIVGPLMARLGYEQPKISAPLNRSDRITQYRRAKQIAMSLRDQSPNSP